MTKKFLFISMMCLSALTAFAHPVDQTNDTIYTQKVFTDEDITSTLEPSYLTNVSEAANWGYNWFIEVKGGASAFLGSPIGCGDVFDRITPAIQVGVGKWFTPAIGGRVEFQGLTFKNAEFHKMHYKFIHADFMYNVTSGLQVNDKGLSRWDVIPFVGVGMIHNSDWTSACMCPGHASGSHPFAFSYGVEARFRVSDRVHILGEISGMTTAKNFDCVHPSSKFGDNMLTASVGLSFTIGKAGWKRVVDAKPYIEENVYLKDYISYMRDENARLQRKLSGDVDVKVTYPKNSYSGLLSLRFRLANGKGKGNDSGEGYEDASEFGDGNGLYGDDFGEDGMYGNDSIRLSNGKIAIGVPVYFFFNLNSDELVDKSQLVNIEEIAIIAKERGYSISVSGAADSATGTEEINSDLSKRRARYIASEFIKRGIDKERIHGFSYGGISKYEPNEANRFTVVILTK